MVSPQNDLKLAEEFWDGERQVWQGLVGLWVSKMFERGKVQLLQITAAIEMEVALVPTKNSN